MAYALQQARRRAEQHAYMNNTRMNTRYPPLIIGAHWLTLLLLAGSYALIELRVFFPKGSDPRELMKAWHFMLGLTVLLVTLARLGVRHRTRLAAIEPPPPAWQQSLATLGHITLYIFLVGMPLLGWVTLSLKGNPIPFFGLELPALTAADKPLGKEFEEIHGLIGDIGYYLIGLHALAALYHHHFLHDNSLLRMLPAKRAAWLAARSARRSS